MDAIKHIYTHLSLRGNQILGLRPQVAEEDPEFLEGGIYYNSATKTFMGGSDGKWSPFGVPQDVLDNISILMSYWHLENGILKTKYPLASQGYAAGATATSAGTSGGGVTSIVVKTASYKPNELGVVDLTEAFENVTVDLSDYYTMEQVDAKIAGIDLSIYAKSADVANTYATKTALSTLQGEVDAIESMLGDGTSEYIDTWQEVVAFLDGYKNADDLATILSSMNSDIASRAKQTDFDALTTRVTTAEGKITTLTNGKADKATTLAGYGITDAYTKTEVNAKEKALADRIATLEGFWVLENGVLKTAYAMAAKGYAAGATATASEGGSGVGVILTTWDGYDSTKARYALGAGLGRDMYDRIGVLESAGYATQSWVEGRYLPLSGGTLTGNIYIGSPSNTEFKCIQQTRDSHAVRLNVLSYGAYLSFGTVNATNTLTAEKTLRLGDDGIEYSSDGNTTFYAIIHKGNIAGYLLYNKYISEEPVIAGYGLWQDQGAYLNVYYSANYNFAFRANTNGLQAKWQTSSSYGASWKNLAFTDSDITGNAASATKLATARTIWGQSFDGTGNVSGNLTLGNSSILDANNRRVLIADGSNVFLGSIDTTSHTTYITGGSVAIRYGTNSTIGITLTNSGNVGIGITSPSYLLHVNGNARVAANLSVGGWLNLSGTASMAGAVTMSSTLSVTGNVTASANVFVGNSITGPLPSGGSYRRWRITMSDPATWIQAASFDGTSTAGNLYLTGYSAGTLASCMIKATATTITGTLYGVDGNFSNRVYGKLVYVDDTATCGMYMAGGSDYASLYTTNAGAWQSTNIRLYSDSSVGIHGLLRPTSDLGSAIGSSSYRWRSLFLASNSNRATGDDVLSINDTRTTSGYQAIRFLRNGADYAALQWFHDGFNNTSYWWNVASCINLDTTPAGGCITLGPWNAPIVVVDKANTRVIINGNLIVSGDTATGSDIRFKDIIEDRTIDIRAMADAPLFTFTWNDRDDDTVHLGSSAQYWEKVAPWLVKGEDFKHLDYATLGVAMAVSLAKKTVDIEERMKVLEKENKVLKKELRRIRNGAVC